MHLFCAQSLSSSSFCPSVASDFRSTAEERYFSDNPAEIGYSEGCYRKFSAPAQDRFPVDPQKLRESWQKNYFAFGKTNHLAVAHLIAADIFQQVTGYERKYKFLEVSQKRLLENVTKPGELIEE